METQIDKLFKESLEIQNACSLCGLGQRFAQAMIILGEGCTSGTDEHNRHLIVTQWLDLMVSLQVIKTGLEGVKS